MNSTETMRPQQAFRQPEDNSRAQRFGRALNAAAQETMRHEHRFADGRAWAWLAALSLLCLGFYGAWLVSQTSLGLMLNGAMVWLLAMWVAVLGLHDAAHGVFCRTQLANRRLARMLALPLGVDADIWRARHVLFHHAHPNVEGADLDIAENGVLRQTANQIWKPHMRWQHYYWPVVAALSLPYLAYYVDCLDVAGKTPVCAKIKLSRRAFWCRKMLHILLMWVAPCWAAHAHGASLSAALLGGACGMLLASLALVYLILGTHWVDAAFYGQDDAPHFYELCFATTCDWGQGRWLNTALGGLNLHLTHHLFPGWHHRHYPKLARCVEEIAPSHGLAYRRISRARLWRAQQAFLRTLAQKPLSGSLSAFGARK